LAGTLYIVGTPIGNLADLTLRAIEMLRRADRVVAEDTRRTRALLTHLDVRGKPIGRLDAHATSRQVDEVVEWVAAGQQVVLVSDAGMPLVSDPGAALVHSVAARELRIEVVPGPSAVTAAIALSGLVSGPFLFLGFLPRQGEKRRHLVERIVHSPEPVVLFEAPTRARATLADLAGRIPDRRAVVCRELTKLHEEAHRGTLAELAERPSWRGELTIVVDLAGDAPAESTSLTGTAVDDAAIEERIRAALSAGTPTKVIASELHTWCGRSRRELYALVQAARSRLQNS
jgi:16S rRNA (cytidine1402-2'-O)-methyltransferase